MNRLVNFDNSEAEPRWAPLNDGVMGGRSTGAAVVEGGNLHFSGQLSLEDNGGFASVRSSGREFDLTAFSALVLRIRGDGRRYQVRLATDARYRGIPVSFGAQFDTRDGEWIEVRTPLDSLKPMARGTSVDGVVFDPSQVKEIGLLIADKRCGAFSLVVDWIGVE